MQKALIANRHKLFLVSNFIHLQTRNMDDCDVISVLQSQGVDYTFDSSYNGRTPTLPTKNMNATVIFISCQRHTQGSDHARGFIFLFQFDSKWFYIFRSRIRALNKVRNFISVRLFLLHILCLTSCQNVSSRRF